MQGKKIFIAKSADVIGDVKIGNSSSVWYQAVLRGDVAPITVGDRSNIQDGTIVHGDKDHDTHIGNGVTIGHNCIIHGCTIGDNVIIGMGAIVLNGAVIGDNSIIGAGSLVTQNKVFPPNSMIFGSPAKVVRETSPEEVDHIKANAREYIESMDNEKGKSFYESDAGVIVVRDL